MDSDDRYREDLADPDATRNHSEARRRAYLDAAAATLFAEGYGRATMSAIASRVGGSKTTLWSYFPSKDALFAAVVDDIAERCGQALSVELPGHAPVETVVRQFAEALIATLRSPEILALHRIVIGEAVRQPHLSLLFYERGPRRGKERLALYFAEAMQRGELRPGDPMRAAGELAGLCQSVQYEKALFNLPGQEKLDVEGVTAAIDTFLRAWSVGGREAASTSMARERRDRYR